TAKKYEVSPGQILAWAQEMDISDHNLEQLKNSVETRSADTHTDTDEVELESSDELFTSEVEYGVSYDNLNYGRLTFWMVFGTGFVILAILTLMAIYQYSSTTIQQQVSEQSEYYQLRDLREREQDILSSFGVVNLEEGIYRIPIDSAISRMAEVDEENE
ncbi:MAG: hypothetical protein WD599_06355, partial [Balneolaceae bacterium]